MEEENTIEGHLLEVEIVIEDEAMMTTMEEMVIEMIIMEEEEEETEMKTETRRIITMNTQVAKK